MMMLAATHETGSHHVAPLGPWRALLVLLLYFALQVVLALAWRLGARLLPQDAPPAGSLVLASVLLGSASSTLLLVRWRWPRRWSAGILTGFGVNHASLRWMLAGALLAALTLPLILGLNALLFPHQGVTQSVLVVFDDAHAWMRVLLTLIIVLLAPFTEELLFRGVLLAGLAERLPLRWAVVLSVALFAALHLPDTGGHWQVLPGLVLLAAGLTWLRLRSGSLLPGFGAHALYNACVLGLTLMPLLHGQPPMR